jgi:hypothetical protein
MANKNLAGETPRFDGEAGATPALEPDLRDATDSTYLRAAPIQRYAGFIGGGEPEGEEELDAVLAQCGASASVPNPPDQRIMQGAAKSLARISRH